MRKKIWSVVMVAVMVAACFVGCSNDSTKDSFISAAKDNGMKEITETTELNRILEDPKEDISYFYDVEDVNIVEYTNRQFMEGIPKHEVTESVIAVERLGENDDHGTTLTYIFYLSFADSETAEEVYKSKIKPLRFGVKNGKKNGVTYTISYQGPDDSQQDNSTVELAAGVYLMDNQIVWIRSNYYSTINNDCVEGFCKKLGLVSPYTLK